LNLVFFFFGSIEMAAPEPDVPNAAEWIQLRAHPNYDIQSQYPFLIKKRSNQRIIGLNRQGAGYLQVFIDGRKEYHHRVIAEQFLANPDNLTEIDHVNHLTDDNHLDNLRWVSHSDNQKNLTSYHSRTIEYLDELPEGAEPLNEVRGRTLAAGHYQQGRNYFVEVAPRRYRRLTAQRYRARGFKIEMRTADGSRISISWTA
jgi:hypothetical protein